MNSPATIVNRSLDRIRRPDLAIGDIQEGSEGSRPALRAYLPALRDLIRTAHWAWARRHVPLQLLGDATGQTLRAGTAVLPPWRYCYALPTDCEKVRYVPWNSQPQTPTNPPIMTNLNAAPLSSVRLIPAPFLVTQDVNYPVLVNAPDTWADVPNWASTAGTGPTNRTVICSNVQNAWCVYSAFTPYPSQWDANFEEALVQVLASRLCAALAPDKFMLQLLQITTAGAKLKISQARASNANESGFPQTTDHIPDWIQTRNAGGGAWGPLGGPGFGGAWGGGACGGLGGGFDGIALGNGSVF